MAFLRHDTLYRFGGYGFWKTRDYFNWFDPSDGLWHLWRDDSSLPSAFSIHWYDEAEDAFYLMGTWEHRPHENFRDVSRDSLFRYEFRTRRWKSLGWFDKSKEDAFMLTRVIRGEITTASFGLVTISGPMGTWLDFPTHTAMSIRPQEMQRLEALKRLHRKADANPNNTSYIVLGDSLYTVIGQGDRSVEVYALALSKELFDSSTSRSILVTSASGSDMEPVMRGIPGWMALCFTALGMAIIYVIASRRLLRPDRVDGHADKPGSHPHPTADAPIGSGHMKDAMSHFLSCLKPSERGLFEFLLEKSTHGIPVRTEDINQYLGLSHRSEELKKVARNKAVQTINHTFRATLKADADLIERFRDSLDKRVVNYRIHPAYAASLQKGFEDGSQSLEG